MGCTICCNEVLHFCLHWLICFELFVLFCCTFNRDDLGSVLLSSLLESDRAVFAHLALAIELFALFPLWCRHIAAFHPVRFRVFGHTFHR